MLSPWSPNLLVCCTRNNHSTKLFSSSSIVGNVRRAGANFDAKAVVYTKNNDSDVNVDVVADDDVDSIIRIVVVIIVTITIKNHKKSRLYIITSSNIR